MACVTEKLVLEPALDRPDLLADAVAKALSTFPAADQVRVAAIDPGLADTAAFCAAYGVGLEQSANCVVLAGKREGVELFAACMVSATTRADVNGLARKHLGVRKLSFAAMDRATEATAMEYGGITPVGLPADWPILVDRAVTEAGDVVIGSGIRGSKLWLPGTLLARLPGAVVLDDLGRPVTA